MTILVVAAFKNGSGQWIYAVAAGIVIVRGQKQHD
jgi:hypothetical protein